jgi:hypothetical protein
MPPTASCLSTLPRRCRSRGADDTLLQQLFQGLSFYTFAEEQGAGDRRGPGQRRDRVSGGGAAAGPGERCADAGGLEAAAEDGAEAAVAADWLERAEEGLGAWLEAERDLERLPAPQPADPDGGRPTGETCAPRGRRAPQHLVARRDVDDRVVSRRSGHRKPKILISRLITPGATPLIFYPNT